MLQQTQVVEWLNLVLVGLAIAISKYTDCDSLQVCHNGVKYFLKEHTYCHSYLWNIDSSKIKEIFREMQVYKNKNIPSLICAQFLSVLLIVLFKIIKIIKIYCTLVVQPKHSKLLWILVFLRIFNKLEVTYFQDHLQPIWLPAPCPLNYPTILTNWEPILPSTGLLRTMAILKWTAIIIKLRKNGKSRGVIWCWIKSLVKVNLVELWAADFWKNPLPQVLLKRLSLFTLHNIK